MLGEKLPPDSKCADQHHPDKRARASNLGGALVHVSQKHSALAVAMGLLHGPY